MQRNRTKKKKINILNLISMIVGIVLLTVTILTIVFLNLLGLIPDKYFILGITLIGIITLLIEFFLINKSKKKIFIVFKYLTLFISLLMILGYSTLIFMLNKTMNLFDNIGILREEVTDYYLIVMDSSIYQEPSDLIDKEVGYFEGIDHAVLNSIKLDINYHIVTDINELKDKFYNKEYDALIISDIIKNKYEDEDEEFNDKIRILKTISIKKEIEDITKRVSLKNTPYNILISGIDTYGDISRTARNDVNMVITINPNTNQILLTSIPRDYYVQLHGTNGCKDKLTHASYYGTNMVVQTIEDILDIDINYYIKVNFTTVTNLVDEIGGIDVYADQSVNIGKCRIHEGMNYLDGSCALAFSRERKSYYGGDLQRGRNQQQVIIAIFNKLTSGTTLITEYSNIIDVLDGQFATNLDMNEVMNFIKYELDDLKSYEFKTTQLSGMGSEGPVYSYPGQQSWIMIPNEETIEEAKNLINQMLNNKRI